MGLLVIIVFVYSTFNLGQTQIYFPDDENVKQIPTPSNIFKGRSYSVINPSMNKIHQTITAHNGYNKGNVLNTIHRTATARNENIDETIAEGITNFSLSVNTYFLHNRDFNNIVFSPINIIGALALILLGSNGKTFGEIASIMGLTSKTNVNTNSENVHEHLGKLMYKLNGTSIFGEQVKLAAAIFVQNNYKIRDLYKQTCKQIYGNEIINVDFRHNNVLAQHMINEWVSDKTNGKITSILPGPPSDKTKVIVTSALYFNSNWEYPFWRRFTKRRPFHPNGRETSTNIQVDMMSNGGEFPYYRDESLECDIMGFPYKGMASTMYVIIPHNSNVHKLRSFEASLTADDIHKLIRNTEYAQSVVVFPKMRLEASSDLREPLQSLGMKSLFNPFEANLAVLSSGLDNRHHSKKTNTDPIQQSGSESARGGLNDVLIFSRLSSSLNCTEMFNPKSNMTDCAEIDQNTQKQIVYKKFGDKLGRRVIRETAKSLDELRLSLNRNSYKASEENPGLYVDNVLHKVYIDITEEGTEAAASTSVSLNRGGDIVTFRADIPFLFFIWHEETKLILFWGTVYEPTPSYR